MNVPRVSVVMSVRDGERWLELACRSVLAQSLAELELIVIDNGSRDGTAAILARLAAGDGRVRVMAKPEGKLAGALTAGIGLARAPLIARLDADDVALPERLARQVAAFDGDRGLVLLGTFAARIDAEGRVTGTLDPPHRPEDLAVVFQRRNPFIHSSVMMRTGDVRAVGCYRAAFEGAEDYDLWLRLAGRGRIAILPEIGLHYRVHAASVTKRSPVRQCFAARLARASARARSATGIDPADGLDGMPDWRAEGAERAWYAAEARVCRLLDVGAGEAVAGAGAVPRPEGLVLPSAADLGFLTHAEKKLARRALMRLLTMPAASGRPRLGDVARLLAHTFRKRV